MCALKSPKDLEGKRLAISVGETFGDMLGPFTRINNVDIGKIQQIQMDASARTSQFLTRKIDVMSVYLSNEWPQIEKRANVKFNMLRVSDFGLNLLGASIIVGNAFAEQNPETRSGNCCAQPPRAIATPWPIPRLPPRRWPST